MYNQQSNLSLIFQKCLQQEVGEIVKIVPNIFGGVYICKPLVAIQLFYSNKDSHCNRLEKRGHVIHHMGYMSVTAPSV